MKDVGPKAPFTASGRCVRSLSPPSLTQRDLRCLRRSAIPPSIGACDTTETERWWAHEAALADVVLWVDASLLIRTIGSVVVHGAAVKDGSQLTRPVSSWMQITTCDDFFPDLRPPFLLSCRFRSSLECVSPRGGFPPRPTRRTSPRGASPLRSPLRSQRCLKPCCRVSDAVAAACHAASTVGSYARSVRRYLLFCRDTLELHPYGDDGCPIHLLAHCFAWHLIQQELAISSVRGYLCAVVDHLIEIHVIVSRHAFYSPALLRLLKGWLRLRSLSLGNERLRCKIELTALLYSSMRSIALSLESNPSFDPVLVRAASLAVGMTLHSGFRPSEVMNPYGTPNARCYLRAPLPFFFPTAPTFPPPPSRRYRLPPFPSPLSPSFRPRPTRRVETGPVLSPGTPIPLRAPFASCVTSSSSSASTPPRTPPRVSSPLPHAAKRPSSTWCATFTAARPFTTASTLPASSRTLAELDTSPCSSQPASTVLSSASLAGGVQPRASSLTCGRPSISPNARLRLCTTHMPSLLRTKNTCTIPQTSAVDRRCRHPR